MVLVDRAAPLDGAKLAAEYARRWAPLVARPVAARAESVTFDLGDGTVTVDLLSRPADARTVDKVAAASWQWKDAVAAARRHHAHLVVTAKQTGASGTAIDAALRLTRVVAVIAAATKASAIYWTPAAMLLDPARFVAESAAAGRGAFPVQLWINVLPAVFTGGQTAVHTLGLAALDMPELILAAEGRPDGALVPSVLRVAEFAVSRRLVLRDGDKFKLDAQDTLVAALVPAPWDAKQTAVRLSFKATRP